MNLYAYVGSVPTGLTDPLGLSDDYDPMDWTQPADSRKDSNVGTAELDLCGTLPYYDPLRRTVIVPVPCAATAGMTLVFVSQCSLWSASTYKLCASYSLSSKKQPQLRLVYDYKAIHALMNPTPGLPSCGPTCRKILAGFVVGVALIYLV